MNDSNYVALQKIQECVRDKAREPLLNLLEDMQPVDKAEIFDELSEDDIAGIFRLLDDEEAAAVLEEMDEAGYEALVERLGIARTSRIVREMSTDDAADLLSELSPDKVSDILSHMDHQDAQEVRDLLYYPEDTAGGLMTNEFVSVSEDSTVAEAINLVRDQARDAETVYYIYVVDENDKLVGTLSFRQLLLAKAEERLCDVMITKVISVQAATDQEEVARIVAKYNFLAVPVVDIYGKLLGIVTVDDVIDVIHEEAAEDMYWAVGHTSTDIGELELSTWQRAKRRMPWMLVLLLGGLLAGSVIQRFTDTLQAFLVLTFFIPVMAGTAGNVATQSLAVILRGLSTGELNSKDLWCIVLRESRVGLLMGLGCGFVLALLAWLWQETPLLGVVTGAALTLNMLVAALLGGFIPLALKKSGIDPAIVSGPFITTAVDIVSMFIYFGLASLIMINFP
jgi:magnesium transporter